MTCYRLRLIDIVFCFVSVLIVSNGIKKGLNINTSILFLLSYTFNQFTGKELKTILIYTLYRTIYTTININPI